MLSLLNPFTHNYKGNFDFFKNLNSWNVKITGKLHVHEQKYICVYFKYNYSAFTLT